MYFINILTLLGYCEQSMQSHILSQCINYLLRMEDLTTCPNSIQEQSRNCTKNGPSVVLPPFCSKKFIWITVIIWMGRSIITNYVLLSNLHSRAWVREWTKSTERPPLVGEVSANFCGLRVPRGQRDRSLRPYFPFSRPEPLLFFQVAPQLYSRGWVDPFPDPLLLIAPRIEPGPLDL
jgi:hypothetical protein